MTLKNTFWLLLPMLAFGQDNSPEGRIKVGVDGSLDYNYRTLRLIHPDMRLMIMMLWNSLPNTFFMRHLYSGG